LDNPDQKLGKRMGTAEDVANIGLIGGNNLKRPNLIANPNAGPQTPTEWFNTSAFALPAQYTFGYGPQHRDWPRPGERRPVSAKELEFARERSHRVPVGRIQRLKSSEFQFARAHLRSRELWSHYQRAAGKRTSVRAQVAVLIRLVVWS
jgi:hypothetical protein